MTGKQGVDIRLGQNNTSLPPPIALPVKESIILASGELISGIVFMISLQMILVYGIRGSISNCKDRQVVLNIIVFLTSINTMIGYGFNATRISVLASNITSFITFFNVGLCLTILMHNSIVRLISLWRGIQKSDKSWNAINPYYYYPLYFLFPFVTLTPIILAAIETHGTGESLF